MPVIPKWAMVISIFHGKPARQDGLGRALIGNKIGAIVTIKAPAGDREYEIQGISFEG